MNKTDTLERIASALERIAHATELSLQLQQVGNEAMLQSVANSRHATNLMEANVLHHSSGSRG